MLVNIHPENPQPRLIKQMADCLNDGGVIIYPTDTIYGIGCDINNPKAIEKICRIKNVDPGKAQLSFICNNLSHLSDYTKNIDTPLFRVLKEHLPGPFTFILPASKQVPKLLQSKKSTIGLRVPNNKICLALCEALGRPILSASLPGDMIEDYTDPAIIFENFRDKVNFVIDAGIGGLEPSTIVDCTTDEWIVTRQGLGVFEG
jgi:tRNA threonylcarbamoyl adenosine modification protein (Sua5/YciO/YrdC/YwlC family)